MESKLTDFLSTSTTMHSVTLTLLLSVLAVVRGNNDCGDSCVCHTVSGEVTAHCTNIGLNQWPQNLPANVTVLDISHNPLAYLQDLPYLPYLHRLDARYCKLKLVSHDLLSQMPELQELELGHNMMVTFPEVRDKGRKLRSLSLDHNQIQALGPNVLRNVYLDQLNLQHNPLSIIHPLSFADSRILTLSLDWCAIDPKAIVNKNSPFKQVSNSLKHLFWSHNTVGLENLPEDIFVNLNLDHLQLTHNSIQDVMFLQSNLTVKDLDLSHNNMSQLDVWGCCANKLSAKFSNCSINRLVNSNEIMSLQAAKSTLEVLDLGFNQITHISVTVFKGMASLKELNLEGNPLQTFVNDAKLSIEILNLHTLNVMDTPISCDCRNEVINYWYNSGTVIKGIYCNKTNRNVLGPSLCYTPKKPTIYRNISQGSISCFAEGIPKPALHWLCDHQRFSITSQHNRDLSNQEQTSKDTIRVSSLDQDCSLLSCTASNTLGSTSVVMSLNDHEPAVDSSTTKIKNTNKLVLFTIVPCCAFVLVIGAAIFCIYKKRLHRKCDKYKSRRSPDLSSEGCQSHMLITP